MFRNSLLWCIFTLSFLELVVKTHPTLHDSSHGFISKHSRYFDDELSGLYEEIASLKTSRTSDVSLKLPLKFEPTFLDFQYRPIGVPHLEKVTLFNIDKHRTVDMTSISGITVHYHSSFFQDKNRTECQGDDELARQRSLTLFLGPESLVCYNSSMNYRNHSKPESAGDFLYIYFMKYGNVTLEDLSFLNIGIKGGEDQPYQNI